MDRSVNAKSDEHQAWLRLLVTALRRHFQRLDKISLTGWGVIVLATALLQRAGLWLFYPPVSYSDTPAYWRLANAITGNWEFYDGTRTPGYPLLLALLKEDQAVYLAQMTMGVIVTLALFYMGWLVSGRAWFAGLVGLAHTLNPGQLFFEPNLLSETATTFWLGLTLAGVFVWLQRPERRSIVLGLGLGIAVSMTWLTRPLFVFLPVWLFLFLVWSEFRQAAPVKPAAAAARLGAFILPAALVLGGWLGFIQLRFGDWSLTTMSGYHMIQHTGHFFEYVPDRYAGLRDTYLKYRAEQIARHGNQTNTIWAAIPEMQEVTGHSFYELSRVLARLSVELIREHPELYLRSVVKGWWYFWRAPVYWTPSAFSWNTIGDLLSPLVLIGRLGLFALNLFFLATIVLALLWRRARQAWRIAPALWCIAGTVWASSVVQTLADHGDNPRFLVPLQSFVVLWVFWIIWQMLHSLRIMEGTLEPAADRTQ
jgi:hypothetical protein